MANKYLSGALGTRNWSDDTGTWVTADGGSTPVAHPTASDIAFFTSNSGAVTVDSASAAANAFTMTGYANTVTIPNGNTLTTPSGVVTLVGTFAGTGTLNLTQGTSISLTYSAATSSSGILLVCASACTHGGPGTSAFTWGKITQSAGNLVLGTHVYTIDLGDATSIWDGGIGTRKLFVSGNITGTNYASNYGTPWLVFNGAVGSTQTVPATCTFTINTQFNHDGTVDFQSGGKLSLANGTGKTFQYVKGSFANLTDKSIAISSAATWDTNGMTWGNITNSGSMTQTLSSNFQATSFIVPIGANNIVFTGADMTLGALRLGAGCSFTMQINRTLNLGSLYINGNGASTTGFYSSSAGTNFNVNYTGTEDGYSIFCGALTDVNFSSARRMYNWFGTVTRGANCTVVSPADTKLVMPQLVCV